MPTTPLDSMLKNRLKTQKRRGGKRRKCSKPNVQSGSPKTLDIEQLAHFSSCRRQFYYDNHQSINSSFNSRSDIEITDVRLASVNECAQNQFMKTLNNTPYFPRLVYHGNKLDNIDSNLRYGLLVPGRPHPSNPTAPVIVSRKIK